MITDLQRAVTRLTMRQIRVVLAIADNGSLVAAAKHLNMTQPAISKALQETEFLLGVELFSRTNRGVFPTPFGQALAAHARVIAAQIHHATEEINDLRDGVGGRVAVGTLLAASADLLPRAIAMLREDRPKVSISVVDGTNDRLLPDLLLGKLDLVVGRLTDPIKDDGIRRDTLIIDQPCVVARAGHPLLGRSSLTTDEVVRQKWILPRPETSLRQQVDRALRAAGIEPPAHAIDSVSHLTNMLLVQEFDYLGVWPWLLAHRDVQAGRIAVLPISLSHARGPVGISTKADRPPSPAAQTFIQALRDVTATIEPCPYLDDANGIRGARLAR